MKKLVSLVLALCLVLSVVAFAHAEEPVTIRLFRATYNTGMVDEDEVKAVQDAINARLGELGAGVRVEIHDIFNSEYGDKANMALIGNEVDLLWTANWWTTIGTNDLYKNNGAYDLTNLLPGTVLWDSMPAWYWEAARYDGKDLFVPVYKEGAEGYMVKILDSNAEAIGTTGAEIAAAVDAAEGTIAKMRALEPYLEKATYLKYPFSLGGAYYFRYGLDSFDFIDNALFSMIGADQKTGELVNPIQTPEYLEYLTLVSEWAQKGFFNVDDELTGSVPATMSQTQDWLVGWWTAVPNNKESEGRDGNQAETFAAITNNYGRSNTTLGSCFAVNAACSEEVAKACVEYLGLLFTDNTIANLYTYGIEGKDYIITDGKVDRTAENGLSATYNHSPWESTSVKAVTLELNEPDNKVEMYDTFNNSASGAVASGFRFNSTEVAGKYNAIVNVFEEYGKPLEMGVYAVEELPAKIAEYQEALDKAGYQEVFAEALAQYEAWKASK